MGSSIFAAMSQLKVESTTWASLLRIPSTERTNGEKNSVAHSIADRACTYSFSPLRKKRINELFLIGLHVSISKSDVNDSFRLALP